MRLHTTSQKDRKAIVALADSFRKLLSLRILASGMSAAGCDWAIVSDQLRLDRRSSAAVMEGRDSKPTRCGVS